VRRPIAIGVRTERQQAFHAPTHCAPIAAAPFYANARSKIPPACPLRIGNIQTGDGGRNANSDATPRGIGPLCIFGVLELSKQQVTLSLPLERYAFPAVVGGDDRTAKLAKRVQSDRKNKLKPLALSVQALFQARDRPARPHSGTGRHGPSCGAEPRSSACKPASCGAPFMP